MSTDLLRVEALLREAQVILKYMKAGEIQVRMRTAAGDDWVDLTRNEIDRHARIEHICTELFENEGYVTKPDAPDAKGVLMVREYYDDPDIVFVKAGEGEEFRGGPADADGYFIYPFCHPGCCRPWGPFKTEETARAWSVKYLPELS